MWMYGLKVTALGFGTVFVALYGLMLLIGVQSKLLVPKKKTEEPKKEAAPVQVSTPVPVTKVEDDDEELAAVIAAAVAACGHQVVIQTITRVTGTTGTVWAATGRSEAMNLRQV